MELINTIIGIPLGYVIFLIYRLLGSYGLSIVVFAVFARIVLFPVMVVAHRNSIRLLQLQPALNAIKQRYAGEKAALNEAQYELFNREKYNPLVGIVPLLVQLLLIVGVLQVMYHPLQHILRMDSATIETLVEETGSTSFAPQLQVLETMPLLDLQFLGLDLGVTPSFKNPSIELIIVLLSGLVALAFCLIQNALSPGALGQSVWTNRGLTILTVGLSLYFAYALPVGVGLYWTVGNFAAIGVVLLLNYLYPPQKLAAESIAYLQTIRKTKEQRREERQQNKKLKTQEKADATRFAATKKQLVFYALTSGQYKFYKTIIDYLLANSNIVIHYLTNDPNDAIFKQQHSQLVPYYASQPKTISLMLRLDTDILVTTVPDLQSFHMKRSIVRNDIEYIHTFHGLTSTHLVYREKAFDHFDTILCVGPHHVAEIRRRETLANLQPKKLIKAGYGPYDQLVAAYANIRIRQTPKPRILIAPSWQEDNILDICLEPLLDALAGHGFEIIVRPHPQYIRLFPERIKVLEENKAIVCERDFSDNSSIFLSDLLITDWSNIGYEFAFCTLKPCVFVNTPMKVMNANYKKYNIAPLDIVLRDKVGVSVEVEDVGQLYTIAERLLQNKDLYKKQIEETVREYLYHPGRNGEAVGKYIIKQLEPKNLAASKEEH
jgi:YidC/Oxa1 family membrane protein insertase